MLLVTLWVCGFKKMYPRCCWLLFAFVGSKKYTRNNVGCYLRLRVQKKCTRDVSEVATVFMGSKKCTREGVCCSLCLRVQKKMYPQQCWLLFVYAGSKKCTRNVCEVVTLFMGSKKCTRNNVGCTLCLRIYKNVPATVLVAPRVCGFKKMHPRTELNGCVWSVAMTCYWLHKNIPVAMEK